MKRKHVDHPDTSKERRNFHRQAVIAYVREEMENTNRFYFVRDISESGAFLISQSKPDIGKITTYSFSFRDLPEKLDITVRVIRHEDQGFAVAFDAMADEVRSTLRKYLQNSFQKRIFSHFNPD